MSTTLMSTGVYIVHFDNSPTDAKGGANIVEVSFPKKMRLTGVLPRYLLQISPSSFTLYTPTPLFKFFLLAFIPSPLHHENIILNNRYPYLPLVILFLIFT